MAQRQRTAFIFVIFLAIYSKLKWFYFVQLRLNLVSIAHTIHIFKNFTYAFFVCLCAMCMRCASHTRSCLILPLRVCEIHLISLDVADRRHRRRLRPRLCVWVICTYVVCVCWENVALIMCCGTRSERDLFICTAPRLVSTTHKFCFFFFGKYVRV